MPVKISNKHCLTAVCVGTQFLQGMLQAQKSDPLASISKICSTRGLQFDTQYTR